MPFVDLSQKECSRSLSSKDTLRIFRLLMASLGLMIGMSMPGCRDSREAVVPDVGAIPLPEPGDRKQFRTLQDDGSNATAVPAQ
jgi:hypothetical protein